MTDDRTAPDRPCDRRPPAPAARPRPPGETASELATLLREQGHTHLCQHTFAGRAVISLPQFAVWITASTLAWVYDGQHTTWPAYDIHGAACRITRVIQQPASQHTPRHARRRRPQAAPGT